MKACLKQPTAPASVGVPCSHKERPPTSTLAIRCSQDTAQVDRSMEPITAIDQSRLTGSHQRLRALLQVASPNEAHQVEQAEQAEQAEQTASKDPKREQRFPSEIRVSGLRMGRTGPGAASGCNQEPDRALATVSPELRFVPNVPSAAW